MTEAILQFLRSSVQPEMDHTHLEHRLAAHRQLLIVPPMATVIASPCARPRPLPAVRHDLAPRAGRLDHCQSNLVVLLESTLQKHSYCACSPPVPHLWYRRLPQRPHSVTTVRPSLAAPLYGRQGPLLPRSSRE
jgi:hypothetical protein